jgi:hypothetical protein
MTQVIVSLTNNLNNLNLGNNSKFAVISIFDSPDNFVDNINIRNAKGTLRCAFNNADKDIITDKISEFLKRWWNKVDTLVIQYDTYMREPIAIIDEWVLNNG